MLASGRALMVERKVGSIVNIVSIAGRNGGGPGAGAYSTAKGGLITLTKAWAKELAPHNVRVTPSRPASSIRPSMRRSRRPK